MYYSKIEAAAVVDHRSLGAVESAPDAKATAVGLLVLIVGLPLLAARVFLWAVARDLRRVAKLGGIVGQAAIEAARSK